jgi:hypothetical protein
MFEKASQVAERVVTSVARRNFLGKFGQGALALAGVFAGALAFPGDARAGGAYCCCSGRCFRARGGCPKGCYRARDCGACP